MRGSYRLRVSYRARVTGTPEGHPLRVLFVSQGGPIWGVEQSMLRLAPLLADRGVEPRLASPPRTELQERWRQLGFAHIPLSVPLHDGLRSRRDSRRRAGFTQIAEEGVTSTRWMRAVASASRKVDVVHSHSLWCHLDVALAGRFVRRPVVLHVHDLVVPGVGRRLLELATRIAP